MALPRRDATAERMRNPLAGAGSREGSAAYRRPGAHPGQPKAGLGGFGPAIAGLIRNSRSLLRSVTAAQYRLSAALPSRLRISPPTCGENE